MADSTDIVTNLNINGPRIYCTFGECESILVKTSQGFFVELSFEHFFEIILRLFLWFLDLLCNFDQILEQHLFGAMASKSTMELNINGSIDIENNNKLDQLNENCTHVLIMEMRCAALLATQLSTITGILDTELDVGCHVKLKGQPHCVGKVLRIDTNKMYGDSYRIQFKDGRNISLLYARHELEIMSPQSYKRANATFKVKINTQRKLYRNLISWNDLVQKSSSYDVSQIKINNKKNRNGMTALEFELIERTNKSAKKYFELYSTIRSKIENKVSMKQQRNKANKIRKQNSKKNTKNKKNKKNETQATTESHAAGVVMTSPNNSDAQITNRENEIENKTKDMNAENKADTVKVASKSSKRKKRRKAQQNRYAQIQKRFESGVIPNDMDLVRLNKNVEELIMNANLAHSMNWRVCNNDKKNVKFNYNVESGDEFDVENDMDDYCMGLYKILYYFVSSPLELGKRNEGTRDFNADRFIGTWIINQFKSKLFGKYKAFVQRFERDCISMESDVKLWCLKSHPIPTPAVPSNKCDCDFVLSQLKLLSTLPETQALIKTVSHNVCLQYHNNCGSNFEETNLFELPI